MSEEIGGPAGATISTAFVSWCGGSVPPIIAAVGTWGRSYSGVQGASIVHNNSSQALNDEYTWDVGIGAGTWTIEIVHAKGAGYGIMSLQLDGVEVGTIDGYSAGTTFDNISQVTGVVVAATGTKRFKVKMLTKNASSSAYRVNLQIITFQKSG